MKDFFEIRFMKTKIFIRIPAGFLPVNENIYYDFTLERALYDQKLLTTLKMLKKNKISYWKFHTITKDNQLASYEEILAIVRDLTIQPTTTIYKIEDKEVIDYLNIVKSKYCEESRLNHYKHDYLQDSLKYHFLQTFYRPLDKYPTFKLKFNFILNHFKLPVFLSDSAKTKIEFNLEKQEMYYTY